MTPQPFTTSQYDDHHRYDPTCGCEACRARLVSQWRDVTPKPGLGWSAWRWLLLLGASLAILAVLGGVILAGQALSKTPKPVKAPEALLKARYACPNDATVAECRGELRKAYAAVEWQQKQRLELARQMVGKLTAWTCIHRGEGAWNSATGNGYYGGLQMDRSFMRTYGRDMIRKHGGYAHLWTPRDQIIVAQRAFNQGRGYNPWPNTSRACGLR